MERLKLNDKNEVVFAKEEAKQPETKKKSKGFMSMLMNFG